MAASAQRVHNGDALLAAAIAVVRGSRAVDCWLEGLISSQKRSIVQVRRVAVFSEEQLWSLSPAIFNLNRDTCTVSCRALSECHSFNYIVRFNLFHLFCL